VIEDDDLGLISGESDFEFTPKCLGLGLAAMEHVGPPSADLTSELLV
jgi:hypothetical protein